jgi:hypothetical protein
MIRSWQPFLSRAALLATVLVTLFFLLGCRGTIYGETPHFPGARFGIDPLYFLIGFIVFGLLGPLVTLVMIGVLLPFIFPPAYRIRIGGMTIELWESRRRYPLVSMAQALIVPVMPDLKMVFGAAKMARDKGAGKVQVAANKVAPLAPGEAFVGEGARYAYRYTALAVIFDEQKRTTPDLMARGLRRAMELLSQEDHVGSVIIPDMTENLLAQPNWITEEQRLETTQQTARLMLDAILSCRNLMKTVKIWVWNPDNTDAFIAEMEKLEEEENAKRASIAARTNVA